MPPKKKEKGAAAAKAALNLSVLQRVDPQITRIEASTAHATLYKLENGTEWKVEDVAGAFFLFGRKVAPFFGMHIMNQKAFDNYHRLIQPDDQFEMQSSFLMFKDDGEYYGLWFGVDDDRESMCTQVAAKAKAAAAGTVPTMSYAAKAKVGGDDRAGGPAVSEPQADSGPAESEQSMLKNLLLNAGKMSEQGGATAVSGGPARGHDSEPDSSEQAHLAALLGAATTGGSPKNGTAEQGHLQNLLASASAASGQPYSSEPTTAAATPPGDHLAGLLLNAANQQHSVVPPASEEQEHLARMLESAHAVPMQLPPSAASVSSTLQAVPPVLPSTAAVLSPAPSVAKGPARAPKNMAHLLQNPGAVTKIVVAPTVPVAKEPTVLDRMRAGERVDDGSRCATTAQVVQQSVTKTLSDLVNLQVAKTGARSERPQLISRDKLRKVLLHVLASTEDETLLSAIFGHYEAIFETRQGSGSPK
eukprot:m.158138 g.158138  ORF g.158138 m.158138 type:complete len:474 (-) comp23684_c0_seq2:79-1500(-)